MKRRKGKERREEKIEGKYKEEWNKKQKRRGEK